MARARSSTRRSCWPRWAASPVSLRCSRALARRRRAGGGANKGGLLSSIIAGLLLPLAALAFLLLFLSALSLVVTAILGAIAAAPPGPCSRLGQYGWPTLLARNPRALQFPLDATTHGAHRPPLDALARRACIVVAALFGLFMSWRINLNRFSLHAGYRNRLIRAFLGAWRARRAPAESLHHASTFPTTSRCTPATAHALPRRRLREISKPSLSSSSRPRPLSAFLKEQLDEDTRLELESYSGEYTAAAPPARRLAGRPQPSSKAKSSRR